MNEVFGKIILASGSPRRKELLKECGFEVIQVTGRDVDESYPSSINPDDVALYLSKIKADAYSDLVLTKNLPLIAADTVVVLDGEVLGKPSSETRAVAMLQQLSGKIHHVVSGVTILFPNGEKVSFTETTFVEFMPLKRELIDYYVQHYNPLDKAGAYGIQEWIGLIGVRRIEGDFYNVMGLPVHRIIEVLQHKQSLPLKSI